MNAFNLVGMMPTAIVAAFLLMSQPLAAEQVGELGDGPAEATAVEPSDGVEEPAPELVEDPPSDEKDEPAGLPRLLVLDIESHGADANLVVLLTEEIVAAARDSGRWEVLSAAEVRELLGAEAQRQLLGCEETECLTDLADAVNARQILTGLATKVDRSTQVRVRLLDTEAGRVVSTTSVSSRSSEELRDMVRRATFEIAEVPYLPRAEREFAWPVREVSVSGSIRPPDSVVDVGIGFALGYQHRLGRVSVGPTVGLVQGRAVVRWDDLIEPYDDPTRLGSIRVGAAGRWPSTGGDRVRAYLTTELGLAIGRAVSIATDRPDWVGGDHQTAYGFYAMPGAGLRLLPRAPLGFALEVHWVFVFGGPTIFDRGIPFDGAPVPLHNERRADLSGILVTGVLRHGF